MTDGNDTNEFPPGEGAVPPEGGGGEAPLNAGRPAVAAAPGKMLFVLIFAAVFIFIIIRSLFFSDKDTTKPTEHHKEHGIPENAKNGERGLAPGELPSPPSEITTPTTPPPPLPPPPPALINPPNPDIHAGAPNNEALSRRIHAAMFAIGGGGGAGKISQAVSRRSAVSAGNDPNGAFADSVAGTKADTAVATKVEHLDITIIQGKLIHAVLESAIDSTLPGPIRAIVNHDTYAESGREILVPKGSRLIGVYNTAIKRGQGRVFIIWERLVRPDGVDIAIESPGVDSLGRAGLAGDLDNRYFEMFSTAILTSSLDIGFAALGDALFGNQQTTTVTNGSGSTTTLSPTSTAMQQAVSNIGQVGSSITAGALNVTPVITIDQGTLINVFVNRDLVFPREVTGTGGGFVN